ncbi:MAG TPA: hypothetical protein VN577_03065 [Terriglobales bacterium]|nr:hypothetical protein [Terriglobales bacterium]
MIQFPPEATPEIRESVALSLLAAQRVASYDKSILTPEQWIERHKEVLQNLNWTVEGGGTVRQEFKDIDVAVHKAIIPFLTAAFAGLAWTLISTALTQLQEMDKDSPWITLYNAKSQRFQITEYQFSTVKVEGNQVHMRMASARFDAEYGTIQVLFVRVKKEHAKFDSVVSKLNAQADLLIGMNAELKKKLAEITKEYIQSIPDEFWKPEKLRKPKATRTAA